MAIYLLSDLPVGQALVNWHQAAHLVHEDAKSVHVIGVVWVGVPLQHLRGRVRHRARKGAAPHLLRQVRDLQVYQCPQRAYVCECATMPMKVLRLPCSVKSVACRRMNVPKERLVHSTFYRRSEIKLGGHQQYCMVGALLHSVENGLPCWTWYD